MSFETPAWEWTERAACHGAVSINFFPEKNESPNPAKAVCKECPVMLSCRGYAIRAGELGIWGGMTTRERARFRQTRGIRARNPGRAAIAQLTGELNRRQP